MLNAFAINEAAVNSDRFVDGNATASLALDASADGLVWKLGEGSAELVVSAELAPLLMLGPGTKAYVEIESSGDMTRWAMLDGQAQLVMSASGDPVIAPAPSGTMTMRLSSSLSASVSRSVMSRGVARLRAFFRGDGYAQHRHYASGTAKLSLSMRTGYGKAPIPTTFTDAAPDCRFYVQPDNATFYVPKEPGL